jgi:phosphatidylserine decarboxylase
MTIINPNSPSVSRVSMDPPGVQPGGHGFFVRLEIAWGRVRRAWLRRCRPGYVRRMAEKRLGHCPGCPHEIVDSRDLKYYRNVCGFWFRPEDDRFRWRDRVRLARYGWAEVVGFSFVLLLLGLLLVFFTIEFYPLFAIPIVAVLGLWGFVISFFRDPERTVPADPQALLSPADGTITDLGEVDDAAFPQGRAFRISMFLSVFNVHVNRIPRSGRIVGLRYFPGGFVDARNTEAHRVNEQLWIDLEEPNGRLVRVKQIAGAVARRLVCWLKVGEEVTAGQRLGMIKFGSRTDILIPLNGAFDLRVKVGDKVKGGLSVLLRFPEPG